MHAFWQVNEHNAGSVRTLAEASISMSHNLYTFNVAKHTDTQQASENACILAGQ